MYDFLASAGAKYGVGFWKPGSGIIHQVSLVDVTDSVVFHQLNVGTVLGFVLLFCQWSSSKNLSLTF